MPFNYVGHKLFRFRC